MCCCFFVCLGRIAVSTALVGFFQSFLVSLVYMIRTQYFIYRVVVGGMMREWLGQGCSTA